MKTAPIRPNEVIRNTSTKAARAFAPVFRARLAGCWTALVLGLSVITGRAQAPAFTNVMVGSDGLFHAQLETVVGQSYTFQVSTNLRDWTTVGSVMNVQTNLLAITDEKRAVSNYSAMFYRARLGVTLTFSLAFHEFADAGHFNGGFTPATPYPVGLNSYTALLSADGDTNPPSAVTVLFTGPAGSGLSSTPADPNNSWTDSAGALYQSPGVSSPAAAPGGLWTISYKGTNQTLNVPDPQAASRLVVPSPTVSVLNDVVQSVTWVYRDASTGAILGGTPSYLSGIQVQIGGVTGGRIYNSPELPPGTFSHLLSSTVNWSNVASIYMAYNDSLGNQYIVCFWNP